MADAHEAELGVSAWCHICQAEVSTRTRQDLELECVQCHSHFIEELGNEDREHDLLSFIGTLSSVPRKLLLGMGWVGKEGAGVGTCVFFRGFFVSTAGAAAKQVPKPAPSSPTRPIPTNIL